MLRRHPTRSIAAIATAVVCAAALPAAAAARTILLPTLTVPVPSPGHATAEVLSVKITGNGATQNGSSFEASHPDQARLPKSVRIFSAARAIRTSSSVTFAFYVLAVNKAKGSAARASGVESAAKSLVAFRRYTVAPGLHPLVLRFTKPSHGDGPGVAGGHAVAQAIYCDACKGDATVQAVINVDAASPQVAAPLTAELKDLFSNGGSTASVFKHVQLARYDNGHAFKAKTKGAKAALRGVADDLIAQKASDVLTTIKRSLGTSIG